MLARGTLAAGTKMVYTRGASDSPRALRVVNTSGAANGLTVFAGPNGDTKIDAGTLADGEVGVTDLRGVLSVGDQVKVTATGSASYAVSEE